MPLFRCTVLSVKGKKMIRTMEAEGLQAVKSRLLAERTPVIEIKQIPLSKRLFSLDKKEVLQLTKEFSRLLHAGLPLYETVAALEEKYRGQKIESLLLRIGAKLKGGGLFSEALKEFPAVFDLLYQSMIANAEKTGRLKEALDELAQFLQSGLSMRKQIVSALLYPTLLFSFCLVVLSSLFFYVIPSLEELFEGRPLPPFTKAIFAISGALRSSKQMLIALFLMMLSLGIGAGFSSKIKERVRRWILGAPGLKHFFAKVALVRFCKAAATLFDGGMPVVLALSEAKAVLRHPVLEEVVTLAEEKMMQGEGISFAFRDHPLIPPLVPRMLSLAEQSGKLSFSLEQIGQIYEEEIETTLIRFASMIQPILLLSLGGLIGFVLLAVLMPLTDVSGFNN